MNEDAIKVMLVDDHTLFRKGLAELCLLYTSPSPRD